MLYYNPDARREIKAAAKARVGGKLWLTLALCAICQLPGLVSVLLLPLSGLNALANELTGMALTSDVSLAHMEALYSVFWQRMGMVVLLALALDLLLTGPLYMGLRRYFIQLYRGGTPELSEAVYCFSSGAAYWRAFRANLWIQLMTLLWGLVFVPVSLVLLVFTAVNGFLMLLGLLVWIVALFALSAKLMTYDGIYNMLYDDEALQPGEAIRATGAIFRGRLLEVFMLILSFAGWAIVLGLPGYLLTAMGLEILGGIVSFACGLYLVAYRGAAFSGYTDALIRIWHEESQPPAAPPAGE